MAQPPAVKASSETIASVRTGPINVTPMRNKWTHAKQKNPNLQVIPKVKAVVKRV
jgi:hypothetical protein